MNPFAQKPAPGGQPPMRPMAQGKPAPPKKAAPNRSMQRTALLGHLSKMAGC